jgi:hypothetical protein
MFGTCFCVVRLQHFFFALRKIRRGNKVFKEKVGSLEGTEDFLLGCGFKVSSYFNEKCQFFSDW